MPDKFPSVSFIENATDVQKFIDEEAQEYTQL